MEEAVTDMNHERQNLLEKWGKIIRNGGIIAGILGLLVESASLVGVAAGLAVSGEIFRRTAKAS